MSNLKYTFYNDADSYLAHYGVLGMKWGVRKDGKPRGFQYGKAAKKSYSKIKQRYNTKSKRVQANRNRSQLSEKDLDRRIKRLRKEKELRELTESEVTPGKKYVKKFIRDNGTKILSGIAFGTGVAIASKYGLPFKQ